jgi:hypothetical protein
LAAIIGVGTQLQQRLRRWLVSQPAAVTGGCQWQVYRLAHGVQVRMWVRVLLL